MKAWPIDSGYAEFNKIIETEVDEVFQTRRMYSKVAGRIPPNAKARVLLLHGNGAEHSRVETMRRILRMLGESGNPDKLKTQQTVRDMPEYMELAAEAIDLPVHGFGPALENHMEVEQSVEWLANYVREMRKQTPDLPIIILTRSSSAALAVEVQKKYPELVDAMILMSPTLPVDVATMDKTVLELRAKAIERNFRINEPGLAWINQILTKTRWDNSTFKVPTMILRGKADPSVQPYEQAAFQDFAAAPESNVKFVEVEGADHDVLNILRSYKPYGLNAYQELYRFLKTRLPADPEASPVPASSFNGS